MEGLQCFNPAQPFNCNATGVVCAGSPRCNDRSLTRPVVNYPALGRGRCSVTGGYAYRGCRMPNYRGTYFYGDYCAAFVKTFVMSGGVATTPQTVTAQVDPSGWLTSGLSSFGVDARGECLRWRSAEPCWKFVPPFGNLEVSGRGAAAALRLNKTGDWTWENLFLATEVPVSLYRVYRGSVNGAYVRLQGHDTRVAFGRRPGQPRRWPALRVHRARRQQLQRGNRGGHDRNLQRRNVSVA